MSKVSRFFIILAAAAVSGCASVQDTFLLEKLDGQAKARALVDEGVQQYHDQLIRKGDLSKVAAVREYFTMALRDDPQNILALRYRDLVDNFRSSQLSRALKEAEAYFTQQKRRDEEDYAMCRDIQTARRLDPANATAARLERDTEGVRQKLIAGFLSKALMSQARAAQAASAADRENADIDAYQTYDKILSLDQGNAAAVNQTKALKEELDRLAVSRVAAVKKMLAAGQFESARDQVALLAQESRKVGGILDARVAAARYSLDYQWARSLYAHKAYVLADERVNDALRIAQTDEALALKSKIADLAAQAEQQASFDSSLQQVDSLIEAGDLAAASGRIEALAKRTDDPARLDLLDSRRQKVRSYLPQMYAEAVTDYRNENFKDAIELLRTIVQVDVDYEQAADYLDKATAKEKLIEQY